MEFDPTAFAVGGVSLIIVTFGLVEFFKNLFNLDGKAVTALSAAMGAILMGLYQVRTLLPPTFDQVFTIVIISLTFGLSASGYYKFAAPRMPKKL